MRCPSDRAQAKLPRGPVVETATGAGTFVLCSEDRLQPTRASSTKQVQTRITSPQTSSPTQRGPLGLRHMPVRTSRLRPFFSAHLALTHTHLRASKEADQCQDPCLSSDA